MWHRVSNSCKTFQGHTPGNGVVFSVRPVPRGPVDSRRANSIIGRLSNP
ncbi:hypothetical protein BRPE64_ACDS08380 [Caballeronia insecticola]|uniref:Uncharacterized protein n=1 Tax=Caballeronia insecticola TaxID=758793 RepID=R4WX91_9BURK|nr:hypothetical protein BRPE64_ACDS08380 [Caballeronia insecticola]